MSEDDELRSRCILAIARGGCTSTVTLQIVARTLGVLPPAYDTSVDAGQPYRWSDTGRANPLNQE